MATTTYTVRAGDKLIAENKNKKATAVDIAQAHRNDTGEAVEVYTNSGKVVFELAAKKTINMSARFTREVEVPEGVEVPDGFRFAYNRPRRQAAVLCMIEREGVEKPYRLLNTKTGKLRKGSFATSREAGSAVLELPVITKASKAPATPAAGGEQAPAPAPEPATEQESVDA